MSTQSWKRNRIKGFGSRLPLHPRVDSFRVQHEIKLLSRVSNEKEMSEKPLASENEDAETAWGNKITLRWWNHLQTVAEDILRPPHLTWDRLVRAFSLPHFMLRVFRAMWVWTFIRRQELGEGVPSHNSRSSWSASVVPRLALRPVPPPQSESSSCRGKSFVSLKTQTVQQQTLH